MSTAHVDPALRYEIPGSVAPTDHQKHNLPTFALSRVHKEVSCHWPCGGPPKKGWLDSFAAVVWDILVQTSQGHFYKAQQ